ncbi:hypothetical protein [uncultured Nocardioides sp.]|uniref:hypothetical protein n=1 Tax=uncultured Nocardioides sp. TaxID=198441 RepID=UPI0026046FA5|nr:hypothetical protein [uncultured Nocardioides sp.]
MALVGTVSHTSAGGLLPSPAVVALMALACVAVAAAFLTGPAGPLRVVALLVGGQTGVHVALTLAAGHVGDAAAAVPMRSGSPLTPAAVDGRRVGSLMEQSHGAAAATAPTIDGSLLAHLQGQGLGMLAAHTAAAVALGLWLALGEKALWRVLLLTTQGAFRAMTRARCRQALLAALAAPRPARLPVRPRVTRPAGLRHHRVVPHRGPPVLLAS